jgi:hypothetical protein
LIKEKFKQSLKEIGFNVTDKEENMSLKKLFTNSIWGVMDAFVSGEITFDEMDKTLYMILESFEKSF